jgi:hypothetical protein
MTTMDGGNAIFASEYIDALARAMNRAITKNKNSP